MENVQIRLGSSDTEINSFLNSMDLYVCMSEHEGFNIPVLDAFGAGIPVISYCAGATPETMKTGGIIFKDKSSSSINLLAFLIDNLLEKSLYANKSLTRNRKSLKSIIFFPFESFFREKILA